VCQQEGFPMVVAPTVAKSGSGKPLGLECDKGYRSRAQSPVRPPIQSAYRPTTKLDSCAQRVNSSHNCFELCTNTEHERQHGKFLAQTGSDNWNGMNFPVTIQSIRNSLKETPLFLSSLVYNTVINQHYTSWDRLLERHACRPLLLVVRQQLNAN
jgi:hypothetical protein